jgi:hypothetical protein
VIKHQANDGLARGPNLSSSNVTAVGVERGLARAGRDFFFLTMKRSVKKLGRRISAEKVGDPHGAPAGYLQNHHKTTSAVLAAGGANPMLAHHSAPPAAAAAHRAQGTKKVVRRSSDTAIREWGDIEAQRQALESLREIGPMSTGASAAGGAVPRQQAEDGLGASPSRKRAVRRSTVGDMDGGPAAYPPIAEGLPPHR